MRYNRACLLMLSVCLAYSADVAVVVSPFAQGSEKFAEDLGIRLRSGNGSVVRVNLISDGIRIRGGKVVLYGAVASPTGGSVAVVTCMAFIDGESIVINGVPDGWYGLKVFLDDGNMVHHSSLYVDERKETDVKVHAPVTLAGSVVGLDSLSDRSFVRINKLLFPVNNDGSYSGISYDSVRDSQIELIYNYRASGSIWRGERISAVVPVVVGTKTVVPNRDAFLFDDIVQIELGGQLAPIGWGKLGNRIPIRFVSQELGYSVIISPDQNGAIPRIQVVEKASAIEYGGLPGDYPAHVWVNKETKDLKARIMVEFGYSSERRR